MPLQAGPRAQRSRSRVRAVSSRLSANLFVDLAILRGDGRGTEFPREGTAGGSMRAPLMPEELVDRGSQLHRLLARNDCDIVAEDIVQFQPTRIVAGQHRRSGRERFDRDSRQCFEERWKNEKIGGSTVTGDRRVVDQPGEGYVPFDPGGARGSLE